MVENDMGRKGGKDILVTGSHRSGSTWVGEMIAASRGVNYIHEPFNISVHHDITIFKYWFEYISARSSGPWRKETEGFLNKFIHVGVGDILRNNFKGEGLHGGYATFKNYIKQIFSSRQLIKDPIAVMSAEWLAKTFDLDVVVIARHPAAFSASLKVKDWTFDFNHFLVQEELMDDYLFPFKKDIERLSRKNGDIIDQAILLWNCIYHVVYCYRSKYEKDWIFLRHEDLSIDPIMEFKRLFARLELGWNGKVEDAIRHSIREVRSSEYHLSAKENILSWKRRLTLSEIERIKYGTEGVYKNFYSEDEW